MFLSPICVCFLKIILLHLHLSLKNTQNWYFYHCKWHCALDIYHSALFCFCDFSCWYSKLQLIPNYSSIPFYEHIILQHLLLLIDIYIFFEKFAVINNCVVGIILLTFLWNIDWVCMPACGISKPQETSSYYFTTYSSPKWSYQFALPPAAYGSAYFSVYSSAHRFVSYFSLCRSNKRKMVNVWLGTFYRQGPVAWLWGRTSLVQLWVPPSYCSFSWVRG